MCSLCPNSSCTICNTCGIRDLGITIVSYVSFPSTINLFKILSLNIYSCPSMILPFSICFNMFLQNSSSCCNSVNILSSMGKLHR